MVDYKKNKLALILPCYNEQETLINSYQQLEKLFDSLIQDKTISPNSFMAFIDDGSKDDTFKIIESLPNKYVRYIKLAKNAGHQNAVLAGLLTYKEAADFLITIDVDLQDDINVIAQMVEKYNTGNEIVYGVRKSRKTDTYFKKNTAQFLIN